MQIKEKEEKKEKDCDITEEKNDLEESFNYYSQYESYNFLNGKFNDINPMKKVNNIEDYEHIFNTYSNNNIKNYFDDFEENENDIIRKNYLQNYKKEVTGSLKKIFLGNKEYIQKLKEEENNNEIIENNNIKKKNDIQENIIGYNINENVTKTLLMNQDNFEDNNFSDSDGIQWVLTKIKKIEENDQLNPINIEGYLPKINQGNKNNEIEYPILNLSSYFLKLANEIFNEVSKLIGPEGREHKTDILFRKICVILLIDSSCYINNKKKVFNFHILCSFAIALHLLEIPYSIAVIADGKFKIILKQFEDQHSFEIFEKVYECLMIRRFRDNLANSLKFAKETYIFSKEKIKNNKGEKPKFYNEHPKKIIITITDGLDEELKLTKDWNKVIFNDQDISFGFIFYKPDLANEGDEKQIDNLWNTFILQSKNAISKVLVHIINKETKNNIYHNLAIFLRDLIGQNKEELNVIEKDYNIDYMPNFMDEGIKLSSIESLKNITFNERGNKIKDNEIYIKNNPPKDPSNKINLKKNINFDKNKLGNICKGSVEFKIKDKYNTFIDNFIIKYNEIDRMSLEKIFKKNKASQKVLSTTGSEIDIISFIISILNKEPRPKIFWEEIGEMKRQYSVSIIIDNSISCFGDISRIHSFQIIRELLSPLLYIEISKIDIILTTDTSPIILCSDIDSKKCLKKDSPLWIGLLKLLQIPYYGSNLSSAINFVYSLNKERNEYTKILFVLTDGLFERNEQILISQQAHNCMQLNMDVIGVGIGSYPIGIENIFEKIIYTIEPSNFLLGLSGFFEQIHTNTNEKMIGFEYKAKMNEFQNIIKQLSKNKKFYFNNLIKELKKIEVNYTTFEFVNKPVALDKYFTNYNEAINPSENEKTQLLKVNAVKGQKILIVMLWVYDMNPSKESPKVIPGNLFRSGKINTYLTEEEKIKNNTICVESAVDIFGLEIFVVLDYEQAIKELTKNKEGNCEYNSVWVMCGPQKAILPKPNSNPNLIGEFMEVINIFWKNGGSIVFFADGDPLFYQVNLFLENAEFPIDEDIYENDDENEEGSIINDESEDINNSIHNDEKNNNDSILINKKDEYDYDNTEYDKDNIGKKSIDNFSGIFKFISNKDTIDNEKIILGDSERTYNIKKEADNKEEDKKEEDNKKENNKEEDHKEENNKEEEEEENDDEEKEINKNKIFLREEEEEEEDDDDDDEDEENKNKIILKEQKNKSQVKENEENEEDEEDEEEQNEEKEKINILLKGKKMKVSFRIMGSHKGGKDLKRDGSGLLNENKQFNGANKIVSHLKRPNIGENLNIIYEGYTISYAHNDNDIYDLFHKYGLSKYSARRRYGHLFKNNEAFYPFIPFAKDSEGGISILLYYGRDNYGDIVIDCGFTKCFIEMKEEGTFRYIRNLSALTSRFDVLMKDGENPKTWKPKAIDYKLPNINYFWKFYQRKVYIIDVDSIVSENDKTYIYDTIQEELYSKYNNIIYFISNGKIKLSLEDIKKEDSLNPGNNDPNINLKRISEEIIKECNEAFRGDYNIEIFSDGLSLFNDNKLMDYILSCDEIPYDKRSFQLLPEANIEIPTEFISETLNNIENIKTYDELMSNYKNIRNCLLFSYFDYSLQISRYTLNNEIERIGREIKDELKDEESKLKVFQDKINILSFYSSVEYENLGVHAAAYIVEKTN